MHCVLLGVTRKLCTLWFGSTNCRNEWYNIHVYLYKFYVYNCYHIRYIGLRAAQFDKMLLQIKVTSGILRKPRSIVQRKFWKGHADVCNVCMSLKSAFTASEWRSFLLLYIPAALCGILPDKYYVHAMLLVKAIRIMLGNSISFAALQQAEELIKYFCLLYEEYYGNRCNNFKIACTSSCDICT